MRKLKIRILRLRILRLRLMILMMIIHRLRLRLRLILRLIVTTTKTSARNMANHKDKTNIKNYTINNTNAHNKTNRHTNNKIDDTSNTIRILKHIIRIQRIWTHVITRIRLIMVLITTHKSTANTKANTKT